MTEEQRKCNVEYFETNSSLFAIEIVNDEGRKYAERIVDKFKNDKYIVARIERERIGRKELGEILEVRANYPAITISCTTK